MMTATTAQLQAALQALALRAHNRGISCWVIASSSSIFHNLNCRHYSLEATDPIPTAFKVAEASVGECLVRQSGAEQIWSLSSARSATDKFESMSLGQQNSEDC